MERADPLRPHLLYHCRLYFKACVTHKLLLFFLNQLTCNLYFCISMQKPISRWSCRFTFWATARLRSVCCSLQVGGISVHPVHHTYFKLHDNDMSIVCSAVGRLCWHYGELLIQMDSSAGTLTDPCKAENEWLILPCKCVLHLRDRVYQD